MEKPAELQAANYDLVARDTKSVGAYVKSGAPYVWVTAAAISVDLARVNQRVLQLAADQSADIARRLAKEGVEVIQGRGRLDGPNHVVVGDHDACHGVPLPPV